MHNLVCRSCNSNNLELVIDLGLQPLANNLLEAGDLAKEEPKFPLDVHVCLDCWLMQITHIVPPVSLFSDYIYFSSFSDQMLKHARDASLRYIKEKRLSNSSFVIEVASNDGYLLKNFVEAGIPAVGFEPAANVAEVARANGIDTHCDFFGTTSAKQLKELRGLADLVLGNNVFAHAPDTNDFVSGLQSILKPDGWVVLEFPYGVEMIEKVEFDTIYHEHVFYFTLTPLIPLFARHGLDIFHVERLPIHGGSLRIFACHQNAEVIRESVKLTLGDEAEAGVKTSVYYQRFSGRAERVKSDIIKFLNQETAEGKRVAAYGASAKGSTLLNYIGSTSKKIELIFDRSTYKHGKFSPGIHLPILPAELLAERRPDYALLLVWNFAEEVMAQQEGFKATGGKFAIPLPVLKIC